MGNIYLFVKFTTTKYYNEIVSNDFFINTPWKDIKFLNFCSWRKMNRNSGSSKMKWHGVYPIFFWWSVPYSLDFNPLDIILKMKFSSMRSLELNQITENRQILNIRQYIVASSGSQYTETCNWRGGLFITGINKFCAFVLLIVKLSHILALCTPKNLKIFFVMTTNCLIR